MFQPGELTLISLNGVDRVARFERDEGQLSVISVFLKGETKLAYVPLLWFHNDDMTMPACIARNVWRKVTKYKFEKLEGE